MKIAFSDNYIGRRGTATSLYDYAHYNETILGNKSIILIPREHPENDPGAIKKFQDRFECFEHDWGNVDQADAIIQAEGADALYQARGGKGDFVSGIVPNLIHNVFLCDPNHYYGDRFAFISDYLSRLCKERFGLDKASSPWMVNIEQHDGDLRDELDIPKDAFVYGYYGGRDCFGVPYVGEPIRQALQNRPDLYILLMNIDPAQTHINFTHDRLRFLPGTVEMKYKTLFINTCDAMLHARHHGETFGLACGEFNRHNKPIVGCSTVGDRCHIEILGDSFIGYSNPQELFNILMGLDHAFVSSKTWDKYSEHHSPEAAMKKFEEVFLNFQGHR